MSTLTDFRDLIAQAHVNACQLAGSKQINLIDATNYPSTNAYVGLYCLFRSMRSNEERRYGERGIRVENVVEVARQTDSNGASFTGNLAEPATYIIKYGDEEHQVVDIQDDDSESAPTSGQQPAVFIMAVVRRGSGLGAGGISN